MSRGFNTGVEEARFEIFNAVNKHLKLGVPISVINLILDNIKSQAKVELDKILEQEKELELKEEQSEEVDNIE